MNRNKLIECFDHYLQFEGNTIHLAAAEERMLRNLDRTSLKISNHSCRLVSHSQRRMLCGRLKRSGENS